MKQYKRSTKAQCLKGVNNLREHREEPDTVILELEVEEFWSGAGHEFPPGMVACLLGSLKRQRQTEEVTQCAQMPRGRRRENGRRSD